MNSSRDLSDDEISSDVDMFADRLRPLMTSEPDSDNDNGMFNYEWYDPDGATFHNLQNATKANDAAADQAARAEAIRAEAIRAQQAQQARPDAQAQAGATPVAQMNQRYKLQADLVPNCEDIRNAYFYYEQSPAVQDVINRFIDRPGTHPPFEGDFEKAAEAAAAWQQQQLGRRGGYKSKSKYMKCIKRKSKSMKYRKRKSKSMKCRKRKSNRRTRRT
jgi:hypothetical protein